MADPILDAHLSSIEAELKIVISEYFFQLTNKQIDFESREVKNLIKFIKESPVHKPEYFIKNLDSFNSFSDFNMLIDILRFLHIANLNMNNKGHVNTFSSKFIESLCNELKNFRNLINHSKILDDELIQRFFEDVYFLFKYIKLPKEKDIFSDYIKKEINLAIKCCMRINIQKQNSFSFDVFKFNEIDLENKKILNSIKKKTLKDKNTFNINKGNTDFEVNELEYIFQNNIKSQILNFNLKLNHAPNISFTGNGDINYQVDFSMSNNTKNKNISYNSFTGVKDVQKIIEMDDSMDKLSKINFGINMSEIKHFDSNAERVREFQMENLLDETLDLQD